ncbi:MAG: hypothetical protein ABFS28_10975 [Bacteroidota bacterium]
MKNTILTLIILLYFTASCQRPDQKDYSFTLEEYRELGFPELNISWDNREYEILFEHLSKMKYQQPMSLPRKNSRKSGPLFDRLSGEENLAFLNDDVVPLQVKVTNIRVYGDFVNDLINIYYDFFRSTQYYHTELVYLYTLKIRVGEEMMNLAGKILSSEKQEDLALVHDLWSIRHIYLNMLYQVMEKQELRSLYPKKEYQILCDSVGAAVKRNMEWFDPVIAKQIGDQLQRVVDSVDIPAVRKEYQELIDGLHISQ